MERNKMNLFVDCCVFLLLSCLVCEVTLKKTENFESNKYDEDRGGCMNVNVIKHNQRCEKDCEKDGRYAVTILLYLLWL